MAGQKIEEYAAFFVGQMVRAMRSTTLQSGLMDGGRAEEVFRGEMDALISRNMAENMGFRKHFAKAIERWDRKTDKPREEVSIRV